MSLNKLGPSCGNTTGPKIDSICIAKSIEDDQELDISSIPFASSERFPIEAFPLKLREIALELSEVYNVPACLPAISALAFIAGAVGKQYVVTDAYRDKQTYLNLYTMLVVERGLGKGNIGGILSKPIQKVENELYEDWIYRCSKTRANIELLREKFKSAKRAANKDDLEAESAVENLQADIDKAEVYLSAQPAILIDDTTSEALADRLAVNNETLLSYSPEAGNLLKVALGKYNDKGGGDYGLLLNAYSGDPHKSDRIGRASTRLENPRLSALWMIQRTVLDSLLKNREAFDRGLTARFLIVDTKARRTKDSGEDRIFSSQDAWDSLLQPLLDLRKLDCSDAAPNVIACSGDAKKVFTAFYNESVDKEEDLPDDLQGECSRWRENAIKVAGIFQLVVDKDRMIDEKIATAACAVVRWCGQGYIRLLMAKRMEGFQDEADKLVSICNGYGGEVQVGKLQSKHSYRGEKLKWARYIASLFSNLLRFEKRKGTTRPQEFLVALPQLC